MSLNTFIYMSSYLMILSIINITYPKYSQYAGGISQVTSPSMMTN